jgi:hypothetical protein
MAGVRHANVIEIAGRVPYFRLPAWFFSAVDEHRPEGRTNVWERATWIQF